MFKYLVSYSIIFLCLLTSCSGPVPQHPVKKETVKLNNSFTQRDYDLDRKIIKEYIAAHPTLSYQNNSDGFWWASVSKKENATPITHDVQITYTYSVYNFKKEMIYSEEEIGKKYAVINKTKQIRALNDVFIHLHEGETAELLLPAFVAYGYAGDGNKIGPAQPLIIELKIIKLTQI